MDDAGISLWAIAVIMGPILLAGAMGYAILRARLRRRRAAAANQRSAAAAPPHRDRRN
ncbi:MAG: hypothetical protein ACREJ5_21765 [Geminicoccaceae bacterium]